MNQDILKQYMNKAKEKEQLSFMSCDLKKELDQKIPEYEKMTYTTPEGEEMVISNMRVFELLHARDYFIFNKQKDRPEYKRIIDELNIKSTGRYWSY